MKLKYLLLCATLSVAFTSSAVLASENGKKPIPGKSDVMVADICLELSNQVQRFFEVNFIRCFPT